MGMFDKMFLDNIRLPDGTVTSIDEDFQTKDLDNNLDEYLVTSDGRLTKKQEDEDFWEPVPHTGTVSLYGGSGIYWDAVFVEGTLRSFKTT